MSPQSMHSDAVLYPKLLLHLVSTVIHVTSAIANVIVYRSVVSINVKIWYELTYVGRTLLKSFRYCFNVGIGT